MKAPIVTGRERVYCLLEYLGKLDTARKSLSSLNSLDTARKLESSLLNTVQTLDRLLGVEEEEKK